MSKGEGEDEQGFCWILTHASQNLRSHDQTRSLGIDLHISGENADILGAERLLEVAELLIGESLDGRGVDTPGHVLLRERDSVLGYHRLSSGCMRSDKDAVALLEVVHRFLLEGVEREGEL